MLVGSWVNVFPYKIMAQKKHPESRRPQRQDRSCRRALRDHPRHRFAICFDQLKIDPDKDVKLVQHSSADPASILAAMEKGEVQFGILAPPFDLIAEKRGYTNLLALPGLGHSLAAKRRVDAALVSKKQP